MSGIAYRRVLIGITLLAVVFTSACGKPELDNKLILLSPHQEFIRNEFATGFKNWSSSLWYEKAID